MFVGAVRGSAAYMRHGPGFRANVTDRLPLGTMPAASVPVNR